MKAFHEQRAYPGSLRLRASRVRNMDFLAHWHDEVELMFITSGQQRMGINNRLLTLSAGQIALVAPLDIHYYEKESLAEGFMLIFPADLLDRRWLDRSDLWQIGDAGQLAHMAGLAAQLVDEMQENLPYFELVAAGLLRLFIAGLLRPAPTISRNWLDSVSLPGFRAMRNILAYIEEHYREPLARDELAARFNLSIAHFSRVFKAATGLTFTGYLTRLRLESACRMISQTDLPMVAIAFDNGFDSIRTFNRVFHKVLRRPPTSFR